LKKVKVDICKSDDLITEEPTVSFSHLAACFTEVETVGDNQSLDQGFPYSREERLYETGILLKEFLKC
jgi:hypothetical protein